MDNKKGGMMEKKGKSCSSKKEKVKGTDKLKKMVDKVWPQTKKDLEEVANKVWPKTKQELESGLRNTKKLIAQGEKYLKEFSERSVKNTKKLAFNLKKEKVYHALGKVVANLSKDKWNEDKKIDSLVKEIQHLDREINKMK